MIIRVPSLKEGINLLEETLDPRDLELDEAEFSKPVFVSVTVDNSETMLSVKLSLKTEVNYVCDRCAIDFVKSVDIEFRLQVLRRPPRDSEEEEAEGLMFLGSRDTQLDLRGEIATELVLSRPLRILCREDCRGLCYKCGADLNEESCNCKRD